jgi:hypothetical protein
LRWRGSEFEFEKGGRLRLRWMNNTSGIVDKARQDKTSLDVNLGGFMFVGLREKEKK